MLCFVDHAVYFSGSMVQKATSLCTRMARWRLCTPFGERMICVGNGIGEIHV